MEFLDPLTSPEWCDERDATLGTHFFQTPNWMRTLHSAYGYRPILARLLDKGQTRISLPLMEVESSLTGKRGISLPFTDYCGPIGPHPSEFPELVDALLDFGAKRSWKYLELRDGAEFFENAPPSTSFWRHELSLALPEATLFSNLSSSTRRAIRKSERSPNLRVSGQLSIESLKQFYGLMQRSRKRQGLPPQPFRFFKSLFENALAQGKGRIFIAYANDRPIAGALFLHHGRHVIYKFGASDKRYQQYRANNLVMWRAILSYAAESFETLDFGRTSMDNEGLRRFKLGWGPSESKHSYLRYQFSTRQWVSCSDQSSGWHTRWFRLMPVPMLRAVGALMYKHIA